MSLYPTVKTFELPDKGRNKKEKLMNRLSSNRLVSEPPSAVGSVTATRTTLIWVAWIATLLLSKLPLVIARDVLGADIP